MTARTIEVEIVYALAHEQCLEVLRVAPGTTVAQAIEQSGFPARFPEIAERSYDVGIFGRRTEQWTVLREFDRIEIYRPLIADPKQARRARTKAKAPRR